MSDDLLRRLRAAPEPPAVALPAVDAALVLEATAGTLLRLFAAHRVAGPADRAHVLRALRQSLELRCRLEQEVLVPALRRAWDGRSSLCTDGELGQVRALASRLVPVADAYDERQTALLTLLEHAVRQRVERVSAVVEFTRRDARMDLMVLGGRLMRALDDWQAAPEGR